MRGEEAKKKGKKRRREQNRQADRVYETRWCVALTTQGKKRAREGCALDATAKTAKAVTALNAARSGTSAETRKSPHPDLSRSYPHPNRLHPITVLGARSAPTAAGATCPLPLGHAKISCTNTHSQALHSCRVHQRQHQVINLPSRRLQPPRHQAPPYHPSPSPPSPSPHLHLRPYPPR